MKSLLLASLCTISFLLSTAAAASVGADDPDYIEDCQTDYSIVLRASYVNEGVIGDCSDEEKTAILKIIHNVAEHDLISTLLGTSMPDFVLGYEAFLKDAIISEFAEPPDPVEIAQNMNIQDILHDIELMGCGAEDQTCEKAAAEDSDGPSSAPSSTPSSSPSSTPSSSPSSTPSSSPSSIPSSSPSSIPSSFPSGSPSLTPSGAPSGIPSTSPSSSPSSIPSGSPSSTPSGSPSSVPSSMPSSRPSSSPSLRPSSGPSGSPSGSPTYDSPDRARRQLLLEEGYAFDDSEAYLYADSKDDEDDFDEEDFDDEDEEFYDASRFITRPMAHSDPKRRLQSIRDGCPPFKSGCLNADWCCRMCGFGTCGWRRRLAEGCKLVRTKGFMKQATQEEKEKVWKFQRRVSWKITKELRGLARAGATATEPAYLCLGKPHKLKARFRRHFWEEVCSA